MAAEEELQFKLSLVCKGLCADYNKSVLYTFFTSWDTSRNGIGSSQVIAQCSELEKQYLQGVSWSVIYRYAPSISQPPLPFRNPSSISQPS